MFALVVQSGTVRTILYGCTISSSSPAAAAKSPQVAGNESLTDLLSYSASLDDLFSNSTGALKKVNHQCNIHYNSRHVVHNGKEKSWGKLATYFSFWETSLICLFFICALFPSFFCLFFSCFTLSLSIIACLAPFIDFDLSLYLSSSPLSFCCLHFSLSLFSLSSSLLFHFCYYWNNWSTSWQSVRLATFFGRPV